MRMMNTIGIGIMAAVGTAAAVGAGSKIVDNHRRKWFDNGYKSGHFAGFIDGAKSMVSIAEETATLAQKVNQNSTVIREKYEKLCEEFEELQENYDDLCEDYYND